MLLAELSDLPAALQADPVAAIRAIESATATIQAECGWSIVESTDVYRGPVAAGQDVWLPTLHLTAVSDVLVDGVASAGVVDFFTSGRVVIPLYRWRSATVSLTYVHGYSVVPASVREACVDEVIGRLGRMDAPRAVRAESERIGEYERSLTYASGTTVSTDVRLRAYRLLNAGVA